MVQVYTAWRHDQPQRSVQQSTSSFEHALVTITTSGARLSHAVSRVLARRREIRRPSTVHRSEPLRLTYCLPSLLFGCEIWNLSAHSIHRLNVTRNNCFRFIFRGSWRESVSMLQFYCSSLPVSQGRRKRYGRYGGRHTNPKFGMATPYQSKVKRRTCLSFVTSHG